MRRILLAALLLGGQRVSAQAPPDTLNAQQRHEAPYSTLNPTRIATGVLLDRTVPFSAVRRLDGSRDTAASYANWRQMHLEFWNASLHRETLPVPLAADKRLYQLPKLPGLPLRVLHYRYNQLLPNAEALGRIRTDTVTRRIYDVAGTESPYVARRAFALGLPLKRVYTDTVQFYIGADQFFGNVRPDSATLRVDFGDGRGLQPVALGQAVRVVYPTRGDKVIRLRWEQAGQVLLAATGLRVSSVTRPDRAISITATNHWPGESELGRCRAYVAAGVGNPKVLDANGQLVQKICKPLVFVEGIDFGPFGNDPTDSLFSYEDGLRYTNPAFRYGEAGWPLLYQYDEEYRSLEKLPAMRQRLQDLGYDVIYVDFNDGEALIQQNAMALVQLLRWLKDPANRTCPNNDVVVMGASMGGQVSRFALTWLEQQHEPHCTSLYVSFDSPHFGANVPLGLQHLLHDLSSLALTDADEEASWDRNKLRSPGAQQMLRLHLDATVAGFPTQLGGEWAGWQNNFANWPTHLRKVAVANGSKNMVGQGFGGGDQLLETSGAGAGVIGHKRTFAVPGTNSNVANHSNVIYYDGNGVSSTDYVVSVGASTPQWDSAPGCIARVARTIWETGIVLVGAATVRLFRLSSIRDNCFMPTVSTLAIYPAAQNSSAPNFGYDIAGQLSNPNRPDIGKYRFDAYFAPPTNEPHVQITDGNGSLHGNPTYASNNSEWIIRELEEASATVPPVLAAGTPNVMHHYGNVYHRFLGSTTINAGGQLFVNKDGVTVNGGPLTASDPASALPSPGLFILGTRDCGATVTINSGGLFELGTPGADAANGYKADVQFGRGSVLDVNGGTLVVNTYSTLRMQAGSLLILRGTTNVLGAGNIIIEPGARLEIRPNAAIALQHGESRLTLQGGFRIEDQATFQPTGNGYVYFDLPNQTAHGNANVEIGGDDAHFILRGAADPGHVVAKVAPGKHIQPTHWGPFEFTVENGTVEMGADAWINCVASSVTLVNAIFRGNPAPITGANRYATVLVHGCGRENIHDSQFIGGDYGLTMNLAYCAGSRAWLERLAFDKCHYGLHTLGKGATLVDCTFNGQRGDVYNSGTQTTDPNGLLNEVGWLMDGAEFADNTVKNCTFTNLRCAINFTGSTGTNLTLEGPQIYRNAKGVVFTSPGELQPRCGAIFNNSQEGITVGQGVLNMSEKSEFSVLTNGGVEDPGSRSVRYHPNISLLDATGLLLNNGHNDIVGFIPTKASIAGWVHVSTAIAPGTQFHAEVANYNRWNINRREPTPQPLDVEVSAIGSNGIRAALLLTDAEPSEYTLCGVNPCVIPLPGGKQLPCWLNERVAHCATCEPISTSFAAADSLHLLVRRVIASQSKYDPLNGNDAEAMQYLAELLLHPLTDTTAGEQRILAEAYRALLTLYAGLADDSLRAAWSQHALLQSVIDQKLANATPDSLLANPEFHLRMDKVLSSYTAGDVAGALAILTSASPLNTPLTQAYFDYWQCFLEKTQQFQTGNLEELDYLRQLSSCRHSGTAGRGQTAQTAEEFIAEQVAKQAARAAKAAVRNAVQLLPNPASRSVTVTLSAAPAGPVAVELSSVTGQTVRRWQRVATTAGPAAWPLDLTGVTPGVYLLRVGTAERTEMRRLVVQP